MNFTYLLKYKFLSVLFCLILVGCAAPPKPKEVTVPKMEPVPFTISEVGIDRKVINANKGEAVTISCHISRPAKVIVKIFDPEMRLIRDLMSEDMGNPGVNRVIWDGRDLEGNMAPDEAYFFTVEATDYQGKSTFYDPTTISGGELFIPNMNFDKGEGRVSYQLPKDARVRIRAGISSGGPLLKNVVNWSPRLSGESEEVWDGTDEAGVIDTTSQKNYQLIGEAVSLPENSIIAYGNTDYDYFKYRNEIAYDRPKKEERPLFQSKTAGLELPPPVPLNVSPEPKFCLDLPEGIGKTKNGIAVVEGKVPIKISLDEKIKRYITEQRYEVIFFVDFKFVTEMEEGYSPFTLVWNTQDVSNGEHIVTVNVATLTGQVSSGSMRVIVQN